MNQMLMHKIKMTLSQHKDKVLIGVIILLVLLLFVKKSASGLLQESEEVIPFPITPVETTDLFLQSRPYILEEGKTGLAKVTHIIKDDGSKEFKNRKVVEEPVIQKELQGVTQFEDHRTSIQNMVADYLNNLQDKNYAKNLEYYVPWANHNSEDVSKYNFQTLFIPLNNPRLVNITPLYENNTSKSIVKVDVAGKFKSQITNGLVDEWPIYAIWDEKEFKLLPPEYFNMGVKSTNQEHLIQGTNVNKTHYVNLTLSNLLMSFPNKMFFQLTAQTTEAVRFNKVRVTVYNNKTREVYYQNTVTYNDVSQKAVWSRSIYKGKSGLRTTFTVPVEFDKDNFGTIYDKFYLTKGDKKEFNYEDINVAFRPQNDTDYNLDYADYIFNLNGGEISQEETVPKVTEAEELKKQKEEEKAKETE